MFLYGNKMQDFPSNYPKHVLMVFHPCINLVVSYNVLAWNYQICFKSYALLKVSEHWNYLQASYRVKVTRSAAARVSEKGGTQVLQQV